MLNVASSSDACREQVGGDLTTDDREFEEIIKKYEKEILIQEEVPEPPLTDSADTAPAQGKSRCITLILNDH